MAAGEGDGAWNRDSPVVVHRAVTDVIVPRCAVETLL
jgi:hypothetical protein